MAKAKFLTFFFLLFCINIFSQVTIGSGLRPRPGTLLDLKESDTMGEDSKKGLGLPRVALSALNKLEPCAITSSDNNLAHVGLMVYNVTDSVSLSKGIYVWDGNMWQSTARDSDSSGSSGSSGPWYQIDNPSLPSVTVDTDSYLNAKVVVGGSEIKNDATFTLYGPLEVEGDANFEGNQTVNGAVAIGTSDKPDANALLDLKTASDGTSTKGLLLPRMSLQSLNSAQPISSGTLADGMLIYNSNETLGGKGVYYWTDNKWNSMIQQLGSWNTAQTTESASSNTAAIYQMGNVGIGTTNPTATLHLVSSSTTSPLKMEGVQQGIFEGGSILTLSTDGNVNKIASSEIGDAIAAATSIPVPNVYSLSSSISEFLSTANIGSKQTITPLKVLKEAIPGMTFNAATSTITFSPGVYQITLVYEAVHNATGCTISSYFVDFPGARIHSTASHLEGNLSNHGGTIMFTAVVTGTTNWTISLGRGQSGNCIGSGMTLALNSTQVSIFRIGDL